MSTITTTLREIDQTLDIGLQRIFAHRAVSELPQVTVQQMHPHAEDFRERLLDHSSPTIKRIFPYQAQAAANILRRPLRLTVTGLVQDEALNSSVTNHTRFLPAAETQVSMEEDDDEADMGHIVVNDLCSNSGKTLTTMLGCLQFAHERQQTVQASAKRLRQSQMNLSCFDAVHMAVQKDFTYSNCVLVLCPAGLIEQWVHAADQALEILDIECPILVQPDAESMPAGTFVAIYSNISKIPRDKINFVAALVVDDFTATTDKLSFTGTHNIVIKQNAAPLVFGRMVLVSAEAGKITRHIDTTAVSSILRKWSCHTAVGWNTQRTAHAMLSCSILPSAERQQAQDNLLYDDTPLHNYTLCYQPSLVTHLFDEDAEMSVKSPLQAFIDAKVLAKDSAMPDSLHAISRLVPAVKLQSLPAAMQCCFCDSTLPDATAAHLLDCLHLCCGDCFALENPCPLCTCPLSVDTVMGTPVKDCIGGLTPISSLRQVCLSALLALYQQEATDCFRVVMIMPNGTGYQQLAAAFTKRVLGCKSAALLNPALKKRKTTGAPPAPPLTLFTQEEGKPFRVYFSPSLATQGTDQALWSADALICVGSGKCVQEVKRLVKPCGPCAGPRRKSRGRR